jgi:hypothetical protein
VYHRGSRHVENRAATAHGSHKFVAQQDVPGSEIQTVARQLGSSQSDHCHGPQSGAPGIIECSNTVRITSTKAWSFTNTMLSATDRVGGLRKYYRRAE